MKNDYQYFTENKITEKNLDEHFQINRQFSIPTTN